MPTWGELLKRIQRELPTNRAILDVLRREALSDLANYTGSNVILYASAHLQKPEAQSTLSIRGEDMEGFMETCYGLQGDSLDLVLHSPGGTAEAAEAIVTYLRSKFAKLRVFVPHEAMSAATMMACAADEIVLGKQSYLGPIDPQFLLPSAVNPAVVHSIPAGAILDQFEGIKKECKADKANLPAYIPMLQQYGPALLEQCKNAQKLSERLVTTWLGRWMLSNEPDKSKAGRIAKELASHQAHLAHGRPLCREYLLGLGLNVVPLEEDQKLQDKVLTIYHAAMHTFNLTPAAKIIENHMQRAFIKFAGQVIMAAPPGTAQPPQPGQPATPPGAAPGA